MIHCQDRGNVKKKEKKTRGEGSSVFWGILNY